VTTDGHSSYPRAIRETMGSDVAHRTSKYLKTEPAGSQRVTASYRRLPVHQDWERPLGLLQPPARAGRTADPR
jgi:hypothetical protein